MTVIKGVLQKYCNTPKIYGKIGADRIRTQEITVRHYSKKYRSFGFFDSHKRGIAKRQCLDFYLGRISIW